MPFQVWIETEKKNAQRVKLILEEASQLSKVHKVKPGIRNDCMIIPSKIFCNEAAQDEAECLQILSDLHLIGPSQHFRAKIVYLPSPSPSLMLSETKVGPIQEAVSEWLKTLPESVFQLTGTTGTNLLKHSPKRWSIYEPMVLLPSGSLQDEKWKDLLQSLDRGHVSTLWTRMLNAIWVREGGRELTHLAINSGIPSRQEREREQDSIPITITIDNHEISCAGTSTPQENILRSPTRLLPLHGDFGPPLCPASFLAPNDTDFQAAFWVTVKQNGIFQTWAPRHTMFSRGNIKEKARLLAFHGPETGRPPAAIGMGTTDSRAGSESGPRRPVAIDLYAGIGYFVFSYAAAGFARVLCWEINPWSVEGLRRGCLLNGWGCRVIRGAELSQPPSTISALMREDESKISVFEEGNEEALGRIAAIRQWEEAEDRKVLGDVVHVNCGFLPSSDGSWRTAWGLVGKNAGYGHTWLHLHENVAVEDVERRKREIEAMAGGWALEEGGTSRVEVEHVELVKTFAPGVWHCVFDVHVQPASTGQLC